MLNFLRFFRRKYLKNHNIGPRFRWICRHHCLDDRRQSIYLDNEVFPRILIISAQLEVKTVRGRYYKISETCKPGAKSTTFEFFRLDRFYVSKNISF
jgi:hypothetical protein